MPDVCARKEVNECRNGEWYVVVYERYWDAHHTTCDPTWVEVSATPTGESCST